MSVSRSSSSSSASSGLKRRSMENHAEPGTALKPAPEPACPPTTSIEPAGFLALDREAGPFLEQLVRERGQRLGDADHVLEGVDALVDVADVRLAAMGADAQRDGAPARVPDHAAGGLGGEHRDRAGVDQPGLAQVPGAGGAAGLLVADEVEDDPAAVEQAERLGGGGAVEHGDQAALHVRAAAADDPPVAALEARTAKGSAPGRRRSGRGSRSARRRCRRHRARSPVLRAFRPARARSARVRSPAAPSRRAARPRSAPARGRAGSRSGCARAPRAASPSRRRGRRARPLPQRCDRYGCTSCAPASLSYAPAQGPPEEPRTDLVPSAPPPAPDDRAWSSRRNVPERAARTDLVPFMALPAETGPTWAPDQLSIWPVEGGRFGIDARYHGSSGRARATHRRGGWARQPRRERHRRARRRHDPPARAARPAGDVAGDRGVPRPPAGRRRGQRSCLSRAISGRGRVTPVDADALELEALRGARVALDRRRGREVPGRLTAATTAASKRPDG